MSKDPTDPPHWRLEPDDEAPNGRVSSSPPEERPIRMSNPKSASVPSSVPDRRPWGMVLLFALGLLMVLLVLFSAIGIVVFVLLQLLVG